MDRFDPFPCYLHHIAFHRLKSYTSFPCPASQLISIFLKFGRVFCALYFSVANTIINEESYFRINVCWDIINVQRKQQGPKDSARWDTRQNRGPIWFCSVYNNSLLSVAQKRIYPRTESLWLTTWEAEPSKPFSAGDDADRTGEAATITGEDVIMETG